MKTFCLLALFASLASLNAVSPARAHADTYQLVPIPNASANSNTYDLYGMDNYGDFVTSGFISCSSNLSDHCYYLYVDGQQISHSSSPPPLAYDNGSACGVGQGGQKGICNNGRDAVIAAGPGVTPTTLYVESASGISVVKSGAFAFLQPVMDTNGDIVFDDGNYFEEYIDVTSRLAATPEPSSIALLSTGILGLVGVVRRKLNTLS